MIKNHQSKPIHIDVFIGGTPLLEPRIVEGLLKFGQTRPHWRFSLRGANFRYTIKWLKQYPVDAVLGVLDTSSIEEDLRQNDIPWVHLLPGRKVPHPAVAADDEIIGKCGAEFFLNKGFMKCAFCGVKTPWSRMRLQGYTKLLKTANLNCNSLEIDFGSSLTWGLSSEIETRLKNWISNLESGTALMVAHDVLANRVVDLCLRQGLRVPQDLAILGVGNHDLPCKLSPVQISSIDANVPEMSYRSLVMLEEVLTGQQPPSPILIPPLKIAERRSTEMIAYADDLVAKAISYIREHACSGLTVGGLLDTFPVSRKTLSRRFQKYVGHSPASEIRKTKLNKVKELLRSTTLSLTEIAYTCGYADLSHMDRAFRSVLGKTPREFREERTKA